MLVIDANRGVGRLTNLSHPGLMLKFKTLLLLFACILPLAICSQVVKDSIPRIDEFGLKVDSVLSDDSIATITSVLTAVTVKARKVPFEQKEDRTVVNVQSMLSSSGSSLLEVLKKSPGVIIDNQNNSISLNGRAGVQVLMNGKPIQLPLNVVLNMLDGVSSSNISRIELITSPSAKFGAEGNAGVIDIITKADPELGTSINFGLTVGYKWKRTLSGSFSLNHSGRRLAYSIDYSNLSNQNRHELRFSRHTSFGGYSHTIFDESKRPNITNQQNFRSGLEWKTGKNAKLSAGVTAYRRNWQLDALSKDSDLVSPDSLKVTDIRIRESNIWQGLTLALGFEKPINAWHELKVNAEYVYYNNDNPSTYDHNVMYDQVDPMAVSKIDVQKKTPIKVFVATADHQYKHSDELIFELGLKAVTSRLGNDVRVRNMVGNRWIADSFFTSTSILREKIAAGYFSANWKPQANLEVRAGLRYEYTDTEIAPVINKGYGYLFPTLLVKKTLSRRSDMMISYSRRITRPTYNDIAPYVFFWGPNTFSSGNTALNASVADVLKASFHIARWTFSSEYSNSKNEIVSWQPELDSVSDNITFTSQNLKYLNTLAITSTFHSDITRWWKLQGTVTLQHQNALTMQVKRSLMVSLNGVNLSIVNSLVLPGSFLMDISGIYRSKSMMGVTNFLSAGSLNVGVQKKLTRAGTITLAVDDLLDTDLWRIKTHNTESNFNTLFRYNFHNRFVRLTFSKNIGNNKLRTIKAAGAAEQERQRLAN
jgi:hypothetical protein